MKPEELRIGNWVEYKRKHYIVFDIAMRQGVHNCQLMPNEIAPIPAYQNGNVKELEPIPLTPEWLEKLGVEKIATGEYKLENLLIDYHPNDLFKGRKPWCNIFFLGDIDNPMLNSIEYVHQLQNLYYVLTGKELEIKK